MKDSTLSTNCHSYHDTALHRKFLFKLLIDFLTPFLHWLINVNIVAYRSDLSADIGFLREKN
jgi:hypothetical protein